MSLDEPTFKKNPAPLTRRRFLSSAAALGAGMLTSRLASAQGSAQPARMRFISWSAPRVEQANIFAGQELGHYKGANLDFEYVSGQGSGDALRQLIAGNGDIAFVGPEAVFFAGDAGAEIVCVYNTYPQNIFVILSKKASGIEKPADLRGKSIGVLSMASGGRYNAVTVLQAAGLKESDVKLVATGPNPGPLLQGQVDAWVALTTNVPVLEKQGHALNVIRCADHANVPTDVFAMTRRDFDNPAKRDAAMRFLRSIRLGTDLMIKEPAKAAALSVKYALDIKDPAAALPIIQEFARASQSPATQRQGLGTFDFAEIQKTADLYWKSDLIKKRLEVGRYFTNELVGKL